MGAEKLVGKGDMLYPLSAPAAYPRSGDLCDGSEREDVINFVKEQGLARYSDEVMDEIERTADKEGKNGSAASANGDRAPRRTRKPTSFSMPPWI
jgi:DNA segregation ATPase FtsK/SpoIIIE-like protein